MRARAVLLAVLASVAVSTAALADKYDPYVMKSYAAAGFLSLFAPGMVSLWVVPGVDAYAKTWPGAKGSGKKGRR
jgi:hypothetical protein